MQPAANQTVARFRPYDSKSSSYSAFVTRADKMSVMNV